MRCIRIPAVLIAALGAFAGCGGDADVQTEFKWRREIMDDLRLTFRYPDENPPPKAAKLTALFALIDRAPKVQVEQRSLHAWRIAWQDEFGPILAKKLDDLNAAVQRRDWEAGTLDTLVTQLGDAKTKTRWAELQSATSEFLSTNSYALSVQVTGIGEQLHREALATIDAAFRTALNQRAAPTGSVASAGTEGAGSAGTVRVRVEPVMDTVQKSVITTESGQQHSDLTVEVTYARVVAARVVVEVESAKANWSWTGTIHDERHALPAADADLKLDNIFTVVREGDTKETAMQREVAERAAAHALGRLVSWLTAFPAELAAKLPALEAK